MVIPRLASAGNLGFGKLGVYQLYMLLIYEDDSGVAVRWRSWGLEVEADRVMAGDLGVDRVMVGIANSVHNYLQFTVDCPSLGLDASGGPGGPGRRRPRTTLWTTGSTPSLNTKSCS